MTPTPYCRWRPLRVNDPPPLAARYLGVFVALRVALAGLPLAERLGRAHRFWMEAAR